jgi:hypothetical protein
MKKKKFYLAMLCVLFTYSAFATHTSLRERTDKWLQSSGETLTPEEEVIPPGEPKRKEWDAPLGDDLLLLIGFGFIYATFGATSTLRRTAKS